MVNGLKSEPAGGQYRFAHMILPHGPYVMDSEGKYVGRQKGTRWQHVQLANRLMTELIDELKRLDRYDQTVLIVHSDTGIDLNPEISGQSFGADGKMKHANGAPLPPERKTDPRLWTSETVRARSQSLLLIKPPRHHGYRTNWAVSQLADIPPTLLGIINVPADTFNFPQGVDLLNTPPADDRARRTFVVGSRLAGKRFPGLLEWFVTEGGFHHGQVIDFQDRHGVLIPR
jgi:arylsulfatase A-like enzyme